MAAELGGNAVPRIFKNLVPHRWRRPQGPPLYAGPAGIYAARQVENRLRDAQWGEQTGRSPRPGGAGNQQPLPADGPAAPDANRRPDPS
jgi:hypothetical protein